MKIKIIWIKMILLFLTINILWFHNCSENSNLVINGHWHLVSNNNSNQYLAIDIVSDSIIYYQYEDNAKVEIGILSLKDSLLTIKPAHDLELYQIVNITREEILLTQKQRKYRLYRSSDKQEYIHFQRDYFSRDEKLSFSFPFKELSTSRCVKLSPSLRFDFKIGIIQGKNLENESIVKMIGDREVNEYTIEEVMEHESSSQIGISGSSRNKLRPVIYRDRRIDRLEARELDLCLYELGYDYVYEAFIDTSDTLRICFDRIDIKRYFQKYDEYRTLIVKGKFVNDRADSLYVSYRNKESGRVYLEREIRREMKKDSFQFWTRNNINRIEISSKNEKLGSLILDDVKFINGIYYCMNEGDLNGDGLDEIGIIFSKADWSYVNRFHLFSYNPIDEKWFQLADFEIREWQVFNNEKINFIKRKNNYQGVIKTFDKEAELIDSLVTYSNKSYSYWFEIVE